MFYDDYHVDVEVGNGVGKVHRLVSRICCGQININEYNTALISVLQYCQHIIYTSCIPAHCA